jgi:hypothetical protein
MLGDPANFIDPDGRAGIPFLQDFMKSDGGFLLEGLAQTVGLAGIGATYYSLVSNLGGIISTAVSVGLSIYSAASSASNLSEFCADASSSGYGGFSGNCGFNYNSTFSGSNSFNPDPNSGNGHPGNPEDDSVWWDVLQFCVDIVGLVPGAGEAADAFNVGVSMYRGDSEGAALSLGAMIPIGGWGPGVSKLAKDFKRIMDKTGVTDWFKGLFSKSTKVKVDSPSYGEVVDDVAENVDAGKATDQVSNGVLKPLGLGSTAKEGVSRVNPINLNEELALKEIMSDPFKGNIAKLKKGMTDDRWHKKDGWKKMTWNNGGVEIHYVGQWQEGVLKAVDDFKIIIP